MRHNYETPETPGESQHPDAKTELIQLLERHAEFCKVECRVIDVQTEWAKRAATTCEILERKLLTETDPDKVIEIARKINGMYRAVIGLLFNQDTNRQAAEFDESDNQTSHAIHKQE